MQGLVWVWAGEGRAWPRQGTAFSSPQGSRPTSRGPREAPTALQHSSSTAHSPAPRYAPPPAGSPREFLPPVLRRRPRLRSGPSCSATWGGATSGARDRSLPLVFSRPCRGGIVPRPRPSQCRQQRSRAGEVGCRRACAVSSGACRRGGGSPRAAPPRAR